MRHSLGYIFGRVGLVELPSFLKEDLAASISEVRVENKELVTALSGFD